MLREFCEREGGAVAYRKEIHSLRKHSATFFKYFKTFTLGTRFPGFAEGFFVLFSVYLSLPSLDPRLYGTEGGGLDVEDLGDSIVVVVQVVLKD